MISETILIGFFLLEKQLANIPDRGFLFLRNTLIHYIPLLALTHGQNHGQRNELILVGLGNLRFLQVNPGWAG